MEVISLEKESLEKAVRRAVEILNKGGIVIHPTDTLYGFAADAASENLSAKIRELKHLEKDKPFSVLVSGPGMIKEYCEVSAEDEKLIQNYFPGPFTFILKSKKPLAAAPNSTLGIRIPDNKFCIALAEFFKKPVITTSANIHGKKPPCSLDEIEKSLLDSADLAIDGGKTKYCMSSAVIDLVEKRIIRKGPLDFSF